LRLLRRLDELYLAYPFFDSRRMAVMLQVNRKRIQRLMHILGSYDAILRNRPQFPSDDTDAIPRAS
jgi:hypothetical protein